MTAELLPSEKMELDLYHLIDRFDPGRWRSFGWGALSNQLGQPEQAKMLDTLKRLHGRGALEIRKFTPQEMQPIPYTSSLDESEFFFRYDFQLRVAPEGRPYFEALEQRAAESAPKPGAPDSPDKPLDPHLAALNITPDQLELLGAIVAVYRDGCRSEFIVTRSHSGSALVYPGRPGVPITADDTDFDQLASVGLLQLGLSSQGDRRGKPTAAGIRMALDMESTARRIGASQTLKRVFIGHGGSYAWRDLKDFLSDRLKLDWEEFNREPAAGISTTERLKTMLDNAGFAFLVFTAEDEHGDGVGHARENVIHEAGLFQGRLGFDRAIILMEEGCAEFSNIHGLTQIRFPRGQIMAVSEEIRRVLEREGIL
jgi:hypothetical protein